MQSQNLQLLKDTINGVAAITVQSVAHELHRNTANQSLASIQPQQAHT